MECSYATSNILIIDDNGAIVSGNDLLENNRTIYSGTATLVGGFYSLVDICTAYWEWQLIDLNEYTRCVKTTNQIVGNTSGQYCVSLLNCCFKQSNDYFETLFYSVPFYYPENYTVYTEYNPNTIFVRTTGAGAELFSSVLAGAQITYNTGNTYIITIDVKQEADNATA